MKVEEICIDSEEYPKQLRNIYDAPLKLYVLGDKKILKQKGVAIVGARKATGYGRKVAEQIATELSQLGINIISGMALGVDSAAHLGTLHEKCIGKTIAVLGSGLDKIYPKENIQLARRIIKSGGCILSEYPIGTSANKLNFPQRNRIISGLSKGVLVVEASEKSGSLITADFALEQGREVFAVPGDINKETSTGTNNLIKQGAKIVTSYIDVIHEI
ncbi:MAG: DNA-processing protein DprA [Clostridia bacterium]|nr:DNA-processing protein DprA [Clostridia bacterium]